MYQLIFTEKILWFFRIYISLYNSRIITLRVEYFMSSSTVMKDLYTIYQRYDCELNLSWVLTCCNGLCAYYVHLGAASQAAHVHIYVSYNVSLKIINYQSQ